MMMKRMKEGDVCVRRGGAGVAGRFWCWLFGFVLWGCAGWCQEIVSVNLPNDLCAGERRYITFGYEDTNTVQLELPVTSLSRSERTFLPDGQPCGTMGCLYRSPVTFTGFPDTSVIRSANDIKYVRINMEHSYMGDIYINITCPNGQKASLMNYSNSGSSSCTGTIPQNARGWSAGSNVDESTYLGLPVDDEDSSFPCDSTRADNAPGTGWDYCWSNNTTEGYSYASGDGIIYRTGHTQGASIRASNVAAGTNFYHPNQSFSSLQGCPLNGDWFIEVLDGWSGDNGYIFEWELSLSDDLIPRCEVLNRHVYGSYVQTINDSLFLLSVPNGLEADTCSPYVLRLNTTCGSIDTLVFVCLHRNYSWNVAASACGRYELAPGVVFTHDTLYAATGETVFGCDSTEYLSVTIYPEYNVYQSEVVCEGEPTRYGYTESVQQTFELQTTHLCDSIVHYYLTVNPVYTEYRRDTICDNAPVLFDGRLLNETGRYEAEYTTAAGCDSSKTLDLIVFPTQETVDRVNVCGGDPFTWIDGHTYSESTYSPVMRYENRYGCDSIIHLALEVDNSFKALLRASPTIVDYNNSEVRLDDISHGISRNWRFLGITDTNITTSFSYPMDEDSVEVVLEAVSRAGCFDDTTVFIRSDLGAVWIPNVFTPGESQNREFKVETYDVTQGEVVIYDRKGMYITSYDLLTEAWDGTLGGKACPQGAYIYLITYTTKGQPNITHKLKGTVTLLR